MVKNLPDNAREAKDGGQEDPGVRRLPGGGNGTCSGILAWKIPWTEKPDGLQFMELQSQT